MYRLNDEKMFYDMAEGQAIVINFTTGIYYGTSSLGSAVMDALLAGADEAGVLAAIQALPGCPADMDAQLKAFVLRLQELEILLSVDAAGSACTIDASALQDGFLLTVDEFNEVQDLILADPVHDVDVEQGWPILG